MTFDDHVPSDPLGDESPDDLISGSSSNQEAPKQAEPTQNTVPADVVADLMGQMQQLSEVMNTVANQVSGLARRVEAVEGSEEKLPGLPASSVSKEEEEARRKKEEEAAEQKRKEEEAEEQRLREEAERKRKAELQMKLLAAQAVREIAEAETERLRLMEEESRARSEGISAIIKKLEDGEDLTEEEMLLLESETNDDNPEESDESSIEERASEGDEAETVGDSEAPVEVDTEEADTVAEDEQDDDIQAAIDMIEAAEKQTAEISETADSLDDSVSDESVSTEDPDELTHEVSSDDETETEADPDTEAEVEANLEAEVDSDPSAEQEAESETAEEVKSISSVEDELLKMGASEDVDLSDEDDIASVDPVEQSPTNDYSDLLDEIDAEEVVNQDLVESDDGDESPVDNIPVQDDDDPMADILAQQKEEDPADVFSSDEDDTQEESKETIDAAYSEDSLDAILAQMEMDKEAESLDNRAAESYDELPPAQSDPEPEAEETQGPPVEIPEAETAPAPDRDIQESVEESDHPSPTRAPEEVVSNYNPAESIEPVDLIFSLGKPNNSEEERKEEKDINSLVPEKNKVELFSSGGKRKGKKQVRLPDLRVQRIEPKRPLVIAVASPKGGVGKSTTSVNMAVMIASVMKSLAEKAEARGETPDIRRVLVMDGDVANGNLAVRFGVKPRPNMTQLHRYLNEHGVPSTYDDPLGDTPPAGNLPGGTQGMSDFIHFTPALPNLNLLAAPESPLEFYKFNKGNFERMITAMSQFYDAIVIDSGTEIIMPSNRVWLEAAHQIFIPTVPGLAALHSCQRFYNLITSSVEDESGAKSEPMTSKDKVNIVMMRATKDFGVDPKYAMDKTFRRVPNDHRFYFRDFDIEASRAENARQFLVHENQDYADDISQLVKVAIDRYPTNK